MQWVALSCTSPANFKQGDVFEITLKAGGAVEAFPGLFQEVSTPTKADAGLFRDFPSE
jgi:hypothetical protein